MMMHEVKTFLGVDVLTQSLYEKFCIEKFYLLVCKGNLLIFKGRFPAFFEPTLEVSFKSVTVGI